MEGGNRALAGWVPKAKPHFFYFAFEFRVAAVSLGQSVKFRCDRLFNHPRSSCYCQGTKLSLEFFGLECQNGTHLMHDSDIAAILMVPYHRIKFHSSPLLTLQVYHIYFVHIHRITLVFYPFFQLVYLKIQRFLHRNFHCSR